MSIKEEKTARIVGVLFLTVNVAFLAGVMSLDAILGSPDYLQIASAKRTQVVLGVLLEIINAIAYVGIAILMFPILRRRFRSMAIGFVGFRLIEFVVQIFADLSPLSLLTLSEESLNAGAATASSFQALGTLLLAERSWAFQMISITFVLGALLFYTMMYQSRLVPRFISIWGLLGAAVVLVNTALDMFGVPPGNLGIVMLLNELFLGVWLIVKGFDSSARVPDLATVELGEVQGAR
jgi:hypothetical protein